jgi:hypothetical protein
LKIGPYRPFVEARYATNCAGNVQQKKIAAYAQVSARMTDKQGMGKLKLATGTQRQKEEVTCVMADPDTLESPEVQCWIKRQGGALRTFDLRYLTVDEIVEMQESMFDEMKENVDRPTLVLFPERG